MQRLITNWVLSRPTDLVKERKVCEWSIFASLSQRDVLSNVGLQLLNHRHINNERTTDRQTDRQTDSNVTIDHSVTVKQCISQWEPLNSLTIINLTRIYELNSNDNTVIWLVDKYTEYAALLLTWPAVSQWQHIISDDDITIILHTNDFREYKKA